MSEVIELYRPSNGAEGSGFMSQWCDKCSHDMGLGCNIITETQLFDIDDPEYPKEWIRKNGKPMCTNFLEK